MNLRLKKVYTVSKKAEKPRLFLQHLVCESAGFQPGEELYVHINEEDEEIVIQNFSFPSTEEQETVHVHSRVSKISGDRRPLLDTAGDKYSTIINVKQKVEINVYRKGRKGQIVVRPLRYNLFENTTIPSPKDERIRLLSICAGAGVGTAAMVDTNFYSSIQAIELEDDSVEVLQYNHESTYIFNGDLNDCGEVAEVDIALVTLPCNEFSTLGEQSGNVMKDLVIATSKIIQSSKASCLLFENVPQFFKSESWNTLKSLLSNEYPYWAQKEIEAWDFGSIALRRRIYAVAFTTEEQFLEYQFPKAPNVRRRKLKDFLDPSHVSHDYKSLEAFMESFNSRKAWRNRSLEMTFVSKDATKIQCIPKRYTGHSASSSYVLSDDKKSWRFLSINEIMRILAVPEWFEFPKHIQKIRRYEMMGQSVDCRVIKAIANRIAYSFMKVKNKIKSTVKTLNGKSPSYNICGNGQLELLLS